MLREGAHGPEVEQLQRDLVTLGYDVGHHGADGWLGSDTLTAIAEFEEDHVGAYEFGRVPPELVALITVTAGARRAEVASGCERARATWLRDLRDAHVGKRRRGTRSWRSITGITLHQWGFLGSETPKTGIATHINVTPRGVVHWLNPLTSVVWHAQNHFNATDVGLDIAGDFEGVEGVISSWWRHGRERYAGMSPQRPTAPQLAAARKAVLLIVEEVARHGGEVRYIHAHRQTSDSRRSDPGSAVWKGVALWAQGELGLSSRVEWRDGSLHDVADPSRTSGGGYPIPQEWDPSSPHPYRGR